MRVGIIGSGNIGGAVARLPVGATGREVALANSRGPETLAGVAGELGDRAHGDTPGGAAGFGEIVLVAIPVLIVFFLLQKQFVAGLTLGSTKG